MQPLYKLDTSCCNKKTRVCSFNKLTLVPSGDTQNELPHCKRIMMVERSAREGTFYAVKFGPHINRARDSPHAKHFSPTIYSSSPCLTNIEIPSKNPLSNMKYEQKTYIYNNSHAHISKDNKLDRIKKAEGPKHYARRWTITTRMVKS